jgi:hypothetical protein
VAIDLQNRTADLSGAAFEGLPARPSGGFTASDLFRVKDLAGRAAPEPRRRGTLLRISVVQDRNAVCFLLEGRLVGPWVDELRRVWQQGAGSGNGSQLTVDLRGLTAMDTRGQRLLEELLQHGATLRCSDVMNQYLVEQMGVSGGPPEACRPCRRFPTQSEVSAPAAETELAS